MNASDDRSLPDVERLVLEARAAHVYLDAMHWLTDPDRRQRNRTQAQDVLTLLDRYLVDADPAADVRSKVQRLRDELCERLETST